MMLYEQVKFSAEHTHSYYFQTFFFVVIAVIGKQKLSSPPIHNELFIELILK